MLRAYISLFSRKGEPLVSAIGLVDLENKTLYIPKVSKKNIPYIDTVVVDRLDKCDGGYRALEVVCIDDNIYYNNYNVKVDKK